MKVTVELDEEQAYLVMNALEFYARIKMGQFDEIHSMLQQGNYELFKSVDMQLVRHAEDMLKRILFPDLSISAYYGIYSKQCGESAKVAWDIYQTMRHDISRVKDPDGGFCRPHHVYINKPLPKVTVEMD